MTSQRWRQIQELYYAALDLAAAERAALLDRADSELRREMESLLALEGSVLSRRARQDGDPAARQALVGIQVGPYRVESKLGEVAWVRCFVRFDTKLNRPWRSSSFPRACGCARAAAVPTRSADGFVAESSAYSDGLRRWRDRRQAVSGYGVRRWGHLAGLVGARKAHLATGRGEIGRAHV